LEIEAKRMARREESGDYAPIDFFDTGTGQSLCVAGQWL
jgi:hypothetical protein